MRLIKEHKRLWLICDETGWRYTPPDFVRIRGRPDLWQVAMDIQDGVRPIDAIMAFESRFTTRKTSASAQNPSADNRAENVTERRDRVARSSTA